MAILTELRDPRVRNVTVTFVEVAPDMRSAKVHVSIMGESTQQNLSLRGLQNAAGFLQHKISDRIDTRYTPRLQFVLDQGVKNSIAVAEKLRELLPGQSTASGEQSTGDQAAGEQLDGEQAGRRSGDRTPLLSQKPKYHVPDDEDDDSEEDSEEDSDAEDDEDEWDGDENAKDRPTEDESTDRK